jgi:hypothetical protein
VSPERSAARRQAWQLAGGVLVLYAVLRATAGPLPQWLDYHDFADTRVLGPIPHAGDVLTNLAILAAGLWCASLHRRMTLTADERPAYAVFALAAILTAFGSAYYHWEPSNARLVWDRLPMALLLGAGLALVLADRVNPALGRESLLPLSLVAMGGVVLWAVMEARGRGDLWLYLVMRVGASVATLALVIARPSRHTAAGLLLAAIALDGVETVSERLDWQIWRATGGIVSGHNLKHVFAGLVIACVSLWVLRRRALAPTAGAPAALAGRPAGVVPLPGLK